MATDAWQQVRAGLTGLWRRRRPDEAPLVEAELDEMREVVLTARGSGDTATEQALTGVWQLRLQQLVAADSAAAEALRHLHENLLVPALDANAQDRPGTVVMKATANDSAQVNQVGGNQFNIRTS
ncbi:hypothetical protein [Streptomyces syringium]|uniref:hypothetical protein n=1 Tax=Streptomyces syringium TaxID=76729 RepID=UPI0033F01C82